MFCVCVFCGQVGRIEDGGTANGIRSVVKTSVLPFKLFMGAKMQYSGVVDIASPVDKHGSVCLSRGSRPDNESFT